MIMTLGDLAYALRDAGIELSDVAVEPPPRIVVTSSGMGSRLMLEVHVYVRNDHGQRVLDYTTNEVARDLRQVPFVTPRPLPEPGYAGLCWADMGDGLMCHRRLDRLQDPLGWRCGWGHLWYPTSDGEGRIRRLGAYTQELRIEP